MAYENATVSNAELFNNATSGISSILGENDWTIDTETTTSVIVNKEISTGVTVYYKFSRSAVDSGTFKVSFSKDGTTYFAEQTFNLYADDYTGNCDVHLFGSDSNKSVQLVIGSTDGTNYFYNMIHMGYIARIDSSDETAYGLLVTGASEIKGSALEGFGISPACLENIYLAATSTDADTTGFLGEPVPFHFVDGLDRSYDGMLYKPGGDANLGSIDYDGNTLRDLDEEIKYIGRYMSPIGVSRPGTGQLGSGWRGTLKRVYAVHSGMNKDSDGTTINKTAGSKYTAATFRFYEKGAQRFDEETDWIIFPLNNNVNFYNVYRGLNVIALPKIA